MPNLEDNVRDMSRTDPSPQAEAATAVPPLEIGGREGPEPTRFGDWELRGRCIDF